jgi:hypothetical protein
MRKVLKFVVDNDERIEEFIGFGFAAFVGIGLIVMSFILQGIMD